MKNLINFSFSRPIWALTAVFGVVLALSANPALAQVTAFKQAVAETASSDDQVAAYYRTQNYQPLWTGEGAVFKARRAALLEALGGVDLHGLPEARYDVNALKTQMRNVQTTRDLGMVEVAISQVFVKYARDVQKGMLIPSKIDEGLVRKVDYRDNADYLVELQQSSDPKAYLRSLPPTSREYLALVKEKLRLESLIRAGGWGATVPSAKYKPGAVGDGVISLRNRLITLGYMTPSASAVYDTKMEQAVQLFQLKNGLEQDGVAGQGTIDEINKSAVTRLKSVIVAMERERWLPAERGKRHVLVNLADFHAQIIDDGFVSFRTRSVIGKSNREQASPEFSDMMEHMDINPSWYVPRSIILRDYLGKLQRNPSSVSYMRITDRQGRVVDRATADFSQYTRTNFPFSLTQPPSNTNALGLVKFMFPNKYNIYLHDSPAKSLFTRETRAFSSGCIRLQDPFDFAYALLARQSDEPEQLFQSALATRNTVRIVLEQPVPVHLIYRTAFTTMKGGTEFRRDVYGRDAKIWNALSQVGVDLTTVKPQGVELAAVQE